MGEAEEGAVNRCWVFGNDVQGEVRHPRATRVMRPCHRAHLTTLLTPQLDDVCWLVQAARDLRGATGAHAAGEDDEGAHPRMGGQMEGDDAVVPFSQFCSHSLESAALSGITTTRSDDEVDITRPSSSSTVEFIRTTGGLETA